ncbi:hypothetical protein DT183_00320 [Salmonella enterica subsp. enterica serovar London]|uniref:Lipoprotein n=5 Tax=Salmonella enterica TaxID=28901 RepID=A0A759YGD3_SALER|nr:hypothetical protein [Salmonella enterica]EAA0985266.1 hypothetical protein [Salmonella enterica subsp. enterica serovar Bareilly]EBS4544406.1 hypothetical protein [Salmonella enterica subsp. enterica serovar Newport]EBV1635777.1 hypothetical protein [Salmonella enterica subsp. enterica serovar Hvittingfoss]EBV1874608.1 hypothetical protein [Salmonella enterica subsp. enterica serovar Adelaide]EBX9325498.1 hypothetical protein [Salmonella enterica subsp. enterica serovar London]EBY8673070.
MRFFKNTAWPCITVIVACISWVLVNGDKVVDNVHAFRTWYGTSKALEGRWNNSTEFDIDPPEWLTNQKDFVEVRITLKNSVVDGTISSGKLRKIFPYDYVLLTGEKRGFRDTLDAYAFDYVLGKKIYFGSFVLSREGERLYVVADETAQKYFPKESILLKVSDDAFPNLKNDKLSNEKSETNENPPIRRVSPNHKDSNQ